ncbi:PAS-domain containing protein [Acuticoccus sp. I52.16.1]|uniref:hybrid sensor histidine kinase/response regulator n=1 Tax=Acuticoccus sp. I52.16.1 TaxID=2928472 RepID=UPI001FD385E2|nr:PAS-domain containing protein [Acuticoccus sp. I52.16.1]UOM34449.1 PAS-domain containing protein [Acuticoccus sp. I52.16.1]
MIEMSLDPEAPLQQRYEKLLKITSALMARVEQSTTGSGAAYAQFERSARLEKEVRARTSDLNKALDLLNDSNARLAQATETARRAQSDLNNAIETVKEGFGLFDSDDRLVMYNSRFCATIADVKTRLVKGLSFDGYVDLIAASAHLALPPGETPATWAANRRARHKDEHVNFSVRLMGERWIQVSEHRTSAGGTVILQTDVSDIIRIERRERERLLDDQARIIHATLEHISQGVCIFDAKARLVGWNTHVSELLAVPITRLWLGAPFAAVFAGMLDGAPISRGGSLMRLQAWMAHEPRGTGTQFDARCGPLTLSVSAQPMPDQGFVVSFTDVTAEREAVRVTTEANETLERRVAERTAELSEAVAAAERANATKSRFVAAASHDLLQPLSAAKLYLSALEADPASINVRDVARKAQGALGSVEAILDALLEMSRLESGATTLEIGNVSLASLMSQLADEFGPLAARKGLDLRVVPSSGVIRTDAKTFRRVLQNLIANAVKYTTSGRVLIGARRCGPLWRVEVHDTGPGIPASQRQNVFKEFRRLNASASASEGMGLGLAIVERACNLLRHRLDLESVEGRGTCFAVSAYAAAPGVQPVDKARRDDADEESDLSGRVALLIDPQAATREALTALMECWGLTTLEAASGEDAEALLEEIGIVPDAVLVAARHAEAHSAIHVIRRLRALAGPVPACLITSDRSRPNQDACAAESIVFIPKPIDPEAILTALRADMVEKLEVA